MPKGSPAASPTKAALDARLNSATARKLELQQAKVEAGSRGDALEAARLRRSLETEAEVAARAIALAGKEAEASKRLLDREVAGRLKALEDRRREAEARARVEHAATLKAAALADKLDRAAQLKAQQDSLTVLRAAATSTSRVARARVCRDVDDVEHRASRRVF